MIQRLLLLLIIFFRFDCQAQQTESQTALFQQAIERGEQFLRQQQQPEGSFRDSLNNLFETWETIIVTDALMDHAASDDSSIVRALNWLHDHESPEELICHNQKCMQAYCLETSALYLQLTKRAFPQKSRTDQLQFIANLQQTDGHWEVGNPDVTLQTGFPSVTGFVLNLIESQEFATEKSEKARQFLAKAQLPDGSWGATWEYYGCPGYAFWQCLPALRNAPEYADNVERASQFILKSQAEDGSWMVPAASNNHISAELHTAFMLLALQGETDPASRQAFQKGITFLLKRQQENGSWDGGLFPIPSERYKKREYLVATALICKVLSVYEKTERK